MDVSMSQITAIQYWKQAYQVGSVVFSDVSKHAESLKSLIGNVTSTQCLTDIECLCTFEKDEQCPTPFTAWLLEGILNASVYYQDDIASIEFFTDAQVKLLVATFDRSAYEYMQLIRVYLKALDTVYDVPLNKEFNCFLDKEYCLMESSLCPIKPSVKTEKERVKFIEILYRTIDGTREILLCYCHSIHDEIWKVVSLLAESGVSELFVLTLPLASDMIKIGSGVSDPELQFAVFSSLSTLLSSQHLTHPSRKKEFLIIWNYFKKHLDFNLAQIECVLQELARSKKMCYIENFIATEVGAILALLPDGYNISDVFKEFDSWPFNDKVLLLEETIVKVLLGSDQFEKTESNDLLHVDVNELSEQWKQIISLMMDLISQSTENAYGKVKTVEVVAESASRILGQLDSTLFVSKRNIVVNFFGNHYLNILNCVSDYIQTSQSRELTGVAVKTLAILLNLPEVSTVSSQVLKRPVQVLLKMLQSPRDGEDFSSDEKYVWLLRSLKNIPIGVVFTSDISAAFLNHLSHKSSFVVPVEIVRCVPFLYMSGITTPSQLIADILMPAILSETQDLQIAAVESAVDLVCAVAQTAYIARLENGDLIVHCRDCEDKATVGSYGKVSLIESHVIKLCGSVLSASGTVLQHLLSLIPRLSMHMQGLRNRDLMMKLMCCISDDHSKVRNEFSKSLTSLIFGQALVNSSLTQDFEYGGLRTNDVLCGDGFLSSVDALRLCFSKLEEEIEGKLALEQWGERLQYLLTTVANIACFPMKIVLKKSLELMLLFVGTCPLPLSSFMSNISAAHKTTPQVLYYTFKPDLSRFFGRLIVQNQLLLGCHPHLTITGIITFFRGLTKTRFASGSEPLILPTLVKAALDHIEAKNILIDYSDYFEVPLPVVITRSFPNIFTQILLSENESTFSKCMKSVETIVNVKISELISHAQKMIIYLLLFNYHKKEEKVLQGLRQVLGIQTTSKLKSHIATCLEARFVGYLLFLVGMFTKEVSAESEKVQALESLPAVLKLMGSGIVTPAARKVLATLNTTLSLNCREYAKLHCRAWDCFVRTVDCRELGPLLATIVVSIVPLLNHAETDAVNILNYLLVEKKDAVVKFLPSIIFLPKHPALIKVHSTIEKYISFSGEDLKDKLIRETSLAMHETVGVRVEGLKALKATLESSGGDVENLINGSDEPDPCVLSLWDTLVACCRDSEPCISMAAASCLGELGAIDPSLLPRKLKPQNALPLSAHDSEFGYLALSEIVRGFQNARTSVDMDAFALGIQECLKIYSVTESSDNATWNRFSATEQSLLRPMFSTRYRVQAPARDTWPDIIFTTKEATSHMSWASMWAGKLIAACDDSQAVLLFRACEPSLKRDPKVLLFFLQYILLLVITQGESTHTNILDEIEAVLSWSSDLFLQSEKGMKSRPVRVVEYCGYPSARSSISESDARACAMTIYLLIDFLHYWVRSFLAKKYTQSGDHLRDRTYLFVRAFLDKINLVKLASSNYEMQEYPRAIQCLEDVALKDADGLSTHLSKLSKAYALYGDLDSVSGASSIQQSAPGVEDQLFYHQVSRQIEEVRIIYEQLGQAGKMTASQVEGMVQCYLALGEPSIAFSCVESYTLRLPELAPVLAESAAECLMKLGDWSKLSNFLELGNNFDQRSWNTQLGKIMVNLIDDKIDAVTERAEETKIDLVKCFTQLGIQPGNEHQGYSCLVKLQVLNDVQKVCHLLSANNNEEALKNLFSQWELKINLLQTDTECMEQVLSTRRSLLSILSGKVNENLRKEVHNELGKYWVKSADVARKAGCLHQAYNYAVSAEQYAIPQTFIQKAQLLWDKGDQEGSLLTLTRGLEKHFPDAKNMKNLQTGERIQERKMAAEALLLYAVYNEETSNCSSFVNMSNYQDAYEVCKELEKTQALLAQCMDRGVSLMEENEQGQNMACELRVMMVNHFGKSLLNGCEYVYQTVPRMLSIWLDLGENLSTVERSRAMAKINKYIKQFTEKLPPFILMTALPQLLSRIGHPNREVFQLLKNILVSLIKAFPQQCLWAIQTLAKSSVPERSLRYKEVIQDPSLRTSHMYKLIEDFTSFCDKLNRLTNKVLPQDSITRGIQVSAVVRDLPIQINSDRFSPIIVPITRFCAISLPKNVTSATHQPFPKNPVTISGIQDDMTVLPSLQRPRKIRFLGSDGKKYDILCKPKDDLRRDARLMEFNNIVNMYLHRDPESRARQLHIRTYVVTPLGESGGLLEWVPNLVGLRPAVIQLYKQYGKFVPMRDIRKHELQVRDSLEKKKEVFLNKLLPLHPPIFLNWFRLTFPDPAGWYAARQAYIRTTAVMSMVGYVLGLGDRHGENILFDSESGDTVHVDFNCLFNKGELFDWKERVPFRLTHNMVNAMGPCGVEGPFRKSCEISMQVLRAQGKTLMSVLTPFAYDPFGSWGKNKEIMQQERDQKIAEALEELRDIERRLNGSLRVKQKNNTFYLSVEGLVRSLITEATSTDNLCQMYLGWGAYL